MDPVSNRPLKTSCKLPLITVDSKHGCKMICTGFPSFFSLGLKDSHVLTFWLLL